MHSLVLYDMMQSKIKKIIRSYKAMKFYKFLPLKVSASVFFIIGVIKKVLYRKYLFWCIGFSDWKPICRSISEKRW